MRRPAPRIGREVPWPFRQRVRRQTVIAVNLGGCVIPCLLAAYEVTRVVRRGPAETLALLVITGVTVWVCYRAARPEPGVGIVLSGMVAALLA